MQIRDSRKAHTKNHGHGAVIVVVIVIGCQVLVSLEVVGLRWIRWLQQHRYVFHSVRFTEHEIMQTQPTASLVYLHTVIVKTITTILCVEEIVKLGQILVGSALLHCCQWQGYQHAVSHHVKTLTADQRQ